MSRVVNCRRARGARRIRQTRLLLISALLIYAASAQGAEPKSEPDPDSESTQTALSVGEVSVTATRAEREILDTPGNVSVIDREQIDRSGAASIPDLLRRESGLSVTNVTTNPAFVTVEARGFNNGGSAGSSVLVLVDGIRVNEADSGITDWALIDMDAVARVEVVRGSASALYGDNAVGAVINIITRCLLYTSPSPRDS